jgi:hypothetical protein
LPTAGLLSRFPVEKTFVILKIVPRRCGAIV